MTLLEALVALVVLGLTASGVLQVYRAGGAAAREAAEWSGAVAAAEAAMEGALLDAPLDEHTAAGRADGTLARFGPRVTLRPWPGAPRAVDELSATVTLSNGATFTLRRLVRRDLGAARVAMRAATR